MDAKQTLGRPMAGKSVTVAYTGTAGTTSALPPETTVIRVLCTTAAFVEIGANPTAVANTGIYLSAGIPEYFEGGPNLKVSAVQVAAGGSLYVTPF